MATKSRANIFTSSEKELDTMISKGGKWKDKAMREKARRQKQTG
jgi:hypothetical protein